MPPSAQPQPQLLLLIDNNAKLDVFVDPAALPPGAVPGDLVAIRPINIGKGKAKDRPILCKVDNLHHGPTTTATTSTTSAPSAVPTDPVPRSRPGKAQVIVHPTIAASFSWVQARTPVEITLVNPIPPSQTVSHVDLFFSNVYLGRSDMLRVSLSLTTTAIFVGQRVLLPGTKARLRVGRLYNQLGHTISSGWVDEETKVVFRSESARCFVFIEVSQEMWQFEEDGSMLREKLDVFLTQLFARWNGEQTEGKVVGKGNPTSHTVSIILYGRVIYEDNGEGEEERAPLCRSEDGVLYRDFYKVILDLTPSPPASVVRTVSSEIRQWQEQVLLRLRKTGEQKLAGRIAFAHESNVLEAANLALNSFEEHWVNRDLQRTGLGLLVITAGTSYYHVPKDLLRLATERMLCHGVGLDLISLSKTPLHTVPLFSFRSHEPGLSEEGNISSSMAKGEGPSSSLSKKMAATATANPSSPSRAATAVTRTTREGLIHEAVRIQPAFPADQRDPLYYDSPYPHQETSIYYAEPLFVFCSFFGFQIDKPHRIDRFMPRARCYELFSQGIGERIPIAIPFLPTEGELDQADDAGMGTDGANYLTEQDKRQARRDRYDAEAVGAVVESVVPGWNGWTRKSGATSGTSTGTEEGRRSSRHRASTTDDEGHPVKLRHTEVAGAREREKAAKRVLSTPNKERGRPERGRDRAVSIAGGSRQLNQSPDDRSKTPKGRSNRSPSIGANSIRTVSGASIRSSATKSSTPALIARLTSTGTTHLSSSSNAATAAPKTGWLGLFRPGPHAPSSTAASVAVQKVEATANAKAEFDLEGTAIRSASGRVSSRGTSPASSRRSSSTAPQHPTPATIPKELPTQPISIGAKAIPTRVADRVGKVFPDSLSAKKLAHKSSVGSKGKESWKGFGSRFNPSKPGKRSEGLADQRRRWASILIRHANDQRAVNWVSITRGACLPITTDYLPTADDLATQYSEYRYSIPTTNVAASFLLRTDNPGRSPILELVTELLSQRLAQGFQICTPANAFGALDEIHLATSKTIPDVLRDVHGGEASAVYLSLANQIHRIAYDRRSQSVVVKIMRRRTTWAKKDYHYESLIWTQGAASYEHTVLKLPFPTIIDPTDWQHLDRLVAGIDKVDQGFKSSLRYWRTRLVLLPAENVPDREYLVSTTKEFEGDATDADIQLQGFFTLMTQLQNLTYTIPGTEKPLPNFNHTDKTPTGWALEQAQSINSPPSDPSQVSPKNQRTSRWSRLATPFVRDESVASTITNASSNGSGGGPHASNMPRDRSLSPGRYSDSQLPPRPESPAVEGLPSKKPTISMTFSMILDLDPKKESLRSEKVLVHLDRSHNPAAAYHIELNWMAISGKVIDSALQNWIRVAGRFGLNLVETTTRSVGDRNNPFQKPSKIHFAVEPPKERVSSLQPVDFYETSLLTSLSFFLDIGADSSFPSDIDVRYSYRRTPCHFSQFIHRSGTVLVSILSPDSEDDASAKENTGGFLYVPNRIFIGHSRNSGKGLGGKNEECEKVMRELAEVCQDESKLREFWDQVQEEANEKFKTVEEDEEAGDSAIASVSATSSSVSGVEGQGGGGGENPVVAEI